MIFDVYSFGEVCFWVLPVVIFLSLLTRAMLGAFAGHSSYGMQIVTFLSYLFCIGVVIHEVAHQVMCKVFGVRIKETQYFRVEHKRIGGKEYTNIGGSVQCEEITSIITGFFLGIAPLLVNGLLVALIYYYSALWMETAYYGLIIYLGIALALGANPSKEDLTIMFQAFQRRPGRGLVELLGLCIFGVTVYCLLLYQVELWITITVLIVFLGLCIFQGRVKVSGSHTRRPK